MALNLTSTKLHPDFGFDRPICFLWEIMIEHQPWTAYLAESRDCSHNWDFFFWDTER